ncbi:Renal dipeptidase [Cohnella kolymensis]|uniref:Renal dipeptidase n=1 Tax=Cohnella kolymensis TaxID=1590652 RepID=A0ABR5A4D5_9BACL|nr:nucleotidyltransferase family protein [Cohnella kolymensis]KIL35410.1 Renal dipeptidase [Cohnella kolymensis]
MQKPVALDCLQLPKELRLMLACLNRHDDEGVPAHDKKWIADMNWDRFLQLARHHRVYPVLYSRLMRIEQHGIPPQVIRALKQEYWHNTFRMLQLSAEMDRVNSELSEQNIPTLHMKGPVLAVELYGDVSLRTSGDLDVLVPIHRLVAAEGTLRKLGYVKDEYIQSVMNDWKWRHHHTTFYHPDKEIKVELHWRLSPGPGKEPTFHELWERSRISHHTGNPIHYLGTEDLLLFLAAHGARHGWSRLHWLGDIDRIARQSLDWNRLSLLLSKYRCAHLLGQAFVLASDLLSTPLNPQMKRLTFGCRPAKLAQDALFYLRQMVNLHTKLLPADVALYHKRHLFSLMSAQQKMLFIISFLHPYPKDIEILYLPKMLHFLYFPLRPFLWAWRKMSKYA